MKGESPASPLLLQGHKLSYSHPVLQQLCRTATMATILMKNNSAKRHKKTWRNKNKEAFFRIDKKELLVLGPCVFHLYAENLSSNSLLQGFEDVYGTLAVSFGESLSECLGGMGKGGLSSQIIFRLCLILNSKEITRAVAI